MMKLSCFQCSHTWEIQHLGRRDECPKCHTDAHVCRNCQFYDRSSYNECRETQADPVKEKDRANFCDYFQPSGQASGAVDAKAALQAAAEALFKKK